MKDKIVNLTNLLESELIELSEAIFDHPELGYEERFASDLHSTIRPFVHARAQLETI